MSQKTQLLLKIMPEERSVIEARAKHFGMTMSSYVAELARWDSVYNVIEKVREGKLKKS